MLDWNILLPAVGTVIVSAGITTWVYKVLMAIIKELRIQITEMKAEIKELRTMRCDKFGCTNRTPPLFTK